METYFRYFNTFNNFVNAKLDANKDENTHEKIFALKKETSDLETKIKSNKLLSKCLLKTAINTCTLRTVEKKTSS